MDKLKRLGQNIIHPRQEHRRRKAERQDRQQGESSSQPPPGLASSSQQATTPARPPSQSGSGSKLTLDPFLKGLKAQNGSSNDSLKADAQNREKSDTYAPGYMLHGTSKSNADSIEQTGLQTSYGGKEGGASKKMGDPKLIENSQGVVHGTPSRRTARTYANLHNKLSAGGKSGGEMSIEDNRTFIGFKAEDPKSINRDNDSDAGYKVSQSIPPNQVVRVPNEIVEEAFDPTNPIPS